MVRVLPGPVEPVVFPWDQLIEQTGLDDNLTGPQNVDIVAAIPLAWGYPHEGIAVATFVDDHINDLTVEIDSNEIPIRLGAFEDVEVDIQFDRVQARDKTGHRLSHGHDLSNILARLGLRTPDHAM